MNHKADIRDLIQERVSALSFDQSPGVFAKILINCLEELIENEALPILDEEKIIHSKNIKTPISSTSLYDMAQKISLKLNVIALQIVKPGHKDFFNIILAGESLNVFASELITKKITEIISIKRDKYEKRIIKKTKPENLENRIDDHISDWVFELGYILNKGLLWLPVETTLSKELINHVRSNFLTIIDYQNSAKHLFKFAKLVLEEKNAKKTPDEVFTKELGEDWRNTLEKQNAEFKKIQNSKIVMVEEPEDLWDESPQFDLYRVFYPEAVVED